MQAAKLAASETKLAERVGDEVYAKSAAGARERAKDILTKMHEVRPILAAFGNAQTAVHDNSARCV